MKSPRSRHRAAIRTATRKDSEVQSIVSPDFHRSVSACASSSMIGPYAGIASSRNAGWMMRRWRRCRDPLAVATPSLPSSPSRDSQSGPAMMKSGFSASAPVRAGAVTA